MAVRAVVTNIVSPPVGRRRSRARRVLPLRLAQQPIPAPWSPPTASARTPEHRPQLTLTTGRGPPAPALIVGAMGASSRVVACIPLGKRDLVHPNRKGLGNRHPVHRALVIEAVQLVGRRAHLVRARRHDHHLGAFGAVAKHRTHRRPWPGRRRHVPTQARDRQVGQMSGRCLHQARDLDGPAGGHEEPPPPIPLAEAPDEAGVARLELSRGEAPCFAGGQRQTHFPPAGRRQARVVATLDGHADRDMGRVDQTKPALIVKSSGN